ncbi:MAG: hypothetical protein WC353_01735 [Candidatus Peribacter sp.]|jgi:hypothetical protein
MHRTRQRTDAEQQLLFPVKPHTRYTYAVERLIEKMRRGFLELPDFERRLIELGIFEDGEDIDFLWSHMMYSDTTAMSERDRFMNTLWHPILRTLETLNVTGLRGLPGARQALVRCIRENSTH